MRQSRIVRTGTFRIAVGLAALFVVSNIFLMATMYRVTQTALDANFLQSVRGEIGAIEEAYRQEGQPEVIEVIGQLLASPQPFSYQVLETASGQKLAGNLPAMPAVAGQASVPAPEGTPNPSEHVILGEGKFLVDGTYLFVGADSHQLIEAREHILFIFGAITLFTSVVAIFLGVLLSGGTLRRIDDIVNVCRAIAENKWDRRIAVDESRDESNLLAVTINGMLDRLAVLMENLRQVSSDIAHDLRTPLTHMRQRLERAKTEATSPAEFVAAIDRAIADSDQTLAIFSALLNLAQIESGGGLIDYGRVNLSDVVNRLGEMYRPVAEDLGQQLVFNVASDIAVRGDEALLFQLFVNLVENAIRHCPKDTRISLDLESRADMIVARVSDTGPGIAAKDRPRAFDRFWRAESSRGMAGHGLGLSLVAAIAKIHRINIYLADNNPGLIVALEIPKFAD